MATIDYGARVIGQILDIDPRAVIQRASEDTLTSMVLTEVGGVTENGAYFERNPEDTSTGYSFVPKSRIERWYHEGGRAPIALPPGFEAIYEPRFSNQ